MATDNVMGNIFRVGRVSSINTGNCTARVTFPDKNDMSSDELPILNRGSSANKDYWLPDIGEQVLCCFLPNGNNQGFIMGSFFSQPDPPQVSNPDIRRIDFSDGTYIEYNRASHTLNINCVGTVNIKGATINLN